MRKLVTILLSLLLVGCSTIKYIPTHEETIIHQVDSIAWHDSTVFHHIYHEHYKDYTGPKDTLNLETAYSRFKAWNDSTSNTLKGEAINKADSIPVKTKWKEKIVYKDSLVTKEIPVPVEVVKEVKYIPGFCKFARAAFLSWAVMIYSSIPYLIIWSSRPILARLIV